MVHSLVANGRLLNLDVPVVMGVINATPDSFYTQLLPSANKDLMNRIENMVKEGAKIIDIGAESTRPNATLVDSNKELQRLIPILDETRKNFPDIYISIDTYKSEVAKAAAEYGADIINDISGGGFDKNMWPTVAKLNLPYILMHIQGTPKDMQINPQYQHVTLDILDYFISKIQLLNNIGIYQVIIDPGFGFGKTINHNYQLLKELESFSFLEKPILAGLSRKGMIYKVLNKSSSEALPGTIAANMVALQNGASILRVHDVAAAIDTIKIFQSIFNKMPSK